MDKNPDQITREFLVTMRSYMPDAILPGHPIVTVGIGWCISMCNTLEAILILGSSGRGGESAPLMRSVIEHANSIEWLMTSGRSGYSKLKEDHEAWRKLVEDGVAGLGQWQFLTSETFERAASADLNKSGITGKVKSKFVVVGKEDPYIWYLFETSYSHPTLNSSYSYLTKDKSGKYITLQTAKADDFNSLTARTAMVALWGARAMAKLIGSSDMDGRLDQIEQELETHFASKPSDAVPGDNDEPP